MPKFESLFTCPHCGKTFYCHGISLDSNGVATIYCEDQNGNGCQKEFDVIPIIEKWLILDEWGYPIKDK